MIFAMATRDWKDRGTAMALRWRRRRRNRNEEAPAHGRELLSDGVSAAGSPAGNTHKLSKFCDTYLSVD